MTPGTLTGLVTVGLLESAAELSPSPWCQRSGGITRESQLRVLTAYSGHLQQWLDDGDLDLSLVYNLAENPVAERAAPTQGETMGRGAGDGGPDAGPARSPREAAARPRVMPALGHGLRTLIDRAIARAQVKIDVTVQTNSMSLQKRFVQRGHGWTILPGAGIAGDVAAGALSAAPLSEPEVWRSIVVGVPRAVPHHACRPGGRPPAGGQVQIAARQGRWLSAELAGTGSELASPSHVRPAQYLGHRRGSVQQRHSHRPRAAVQFPFAHPQVCSVLLSEITDELDMDAHHHFWDPGRYTYPWMAGRRMDPIRGSGSSPYLVVAGRQQVG